MPRPAHIRALDAALMEHLARLEYAEKMLAQVLDQNIVELDRVHAKVDAAAEERASAYADAQQCELAIKNLGYSNVVGGTQGKGFSLETDKQAARNRRAQSGENND